MWWVVTWQKKLVIELRSEWKKISNLFYQVRKSIIYINQDLLRLSHVTESGSWHIIYMLYLVFLFFMKVQETCYSYFQKKKF